MAPYTFCLHNSSCSEFEPWSDYFSAAFENVALKAAIVSLTIVSTVSILIGLYGIIWYERFGSDVKRVLLNRLVSSVCWTGFEYFCLVLTADLFRFVAGPLPDVVCVAHLILKNAVFIQTVLFLSAIAIVRYLLYFWQRETSDFQDEFWRHLINIWVVGFSLINQFVFLLMPGVQTMNFYICNGQNPKVLEEGGQHYKKNYFFLAVMVLSVILQMYVAIRIVFHKIKVHETSTEKTNFIVSEVLVVLAFISVSSLMFYFLLKINSLEAVTINFYPNYLYVYGQQTLGPVIVGFTVCILLYSRNFGLRTTVVKESTEFLKGMF